MREFGALGLALCDGFGLELEPNPSLLMESNIFSNKWVVKVMGPWACSW